MSEMVERVAEALRETCEGPRGDFQFADDAGLPQYRKMARAAIEAMREPEVAMLVACYQRIGIPEKPLFAHVYRTMLDAAIAEKSP